MYFPNPLFSKFLSSDLSTTGNNHTIEPSYRFESDSKEAFLEVELPGVEKEDISVDVNNHHLTVTAKRIKETLLGKQEENGDGMKDGENDSTRNEKGSITYSLNVRIGHDADVNNISSRSYKNGVLVLRIPSQTKANTRRITIE